VTLAEWPALRFRYGLEVDDQLNTPSDDADTFALEPSSQTGRAFGLGIASDIGARNLFGNAISVGLAGRYTRDFRALRAYATTPLFFGRRITSNVFVSRSRERVSETAETVEGPGRKIVADETELTLEQRVRPFPKTEVSYRYTFGRNHTFNATPNPLDPFPFDSTATVAKLASTVLVDRRNDLVDATRGWFHASDVEYAPSALGSDVRFAKYLLQQRYYRRVRRVVLASAAQLGLARGFDGQGLLPVERFFAGGGNSVRGYDEDALSPRDRFDTIVGGNALIVLNEEVRFPIFKWFGGVGFFDAGRAFETVGSMTLKGLPTGTGVGLRVQTPIVLLRFDVGVPLDTTLGARSRRWFFSIGQLF
jgi:outer membrane protein assembly factor BamA